MSICNLTTNQNDLQTQDWVITQEEELCDLCSWQCS